MLGNFSFGDYFKEEAIQMAWEVSTEVFGLDPNRIWPTVFREDDEAFEIWKKYVPESRITRFDEKDNFWAMGDTGPCGPCSELYYDRGENFGPAKNPKDDEGGERYLEFWNLVFMQFNRSASGELVKLPRPSIDTGAGLERIISLKMDVDSVFETDVLRGLIAQTEILFNTPYDLKSDKAAAFRVIADHLRCLAFAIADGVEPSNVDRGYVLRKVLRRAVRYGRTLGADSPFLAKILPELVRMMGADYPELKKSETRIAEILTREEESFLKTLKRGGNLLSQVILDAKKTGIIKGDDAFKLKDTYGFPLEEVQLIAKDDDLKVDLKRYQELEEEAKEKSRQVHKSVKQMAEESVFENCGKSEFVGYDVDAADGVVTYLVQDGRLVDSLTGPGMVILDKTPFYAEMGGQIGDKGSLVFAGGEAAIEETRSPYKGVIAHIGTVQGILKVGDKVHAKVDSARRRKIEANHTATHLLHWALHKVLGEHIKQAGSVVDEERLRFDFSHHKSLTREEMTAIEDLVNEQIRENNAVKRYEMAYDEAIKRSDIKQFFGEKYGSKVRVIDLGESKELCGGTHISDLGRIGLFRIAKEGSIAAGVRRIEAVTGSEAEGIYKSSDNLLESLAEALKVPKEKLAERVGKLIEENKQLAHDLKQIKKKELEELGRHFLERKENLKGIDALFIKTELAPEDLKTLSDDLMGRFQGVLVVANVQPEKISLLARVSDETVKKGMDAGALIKKVAPTIEGTGGGRPNSAQAGGKAVQKADEALNESREYILKLC
jgi:alanyl-tRNA synthetase